MDRIRTCCIALLVLAGVLESAAASQKAETEDGRAVTLHEDGTWTYAVDPEENESARQDLRLIQSGNLEGYPEDNVGNTFTNFFTLPEWRFEKEPGRDTKTIVFTGRLRNECALKTVRGVSRKFSEDAPVKIEFTMSGTESFDVKYAEVGVKAGERWTPRPVRVDIFLDRIFGKIREE